MRVRDGESFDLNAVDRAGADGALWSLPHGGDLDANLVRLSAGARVESHVNDAVDVLVVAVEGGGVVTVDGAPHELRPGRLVLVPKGCARSIAATADSDVVYLTVHRSRPLLGIGAASSEGGEAACWANRLCDECGAPDGEHHAGCRRR